MNLMIASDIHGSARYCRDLLAAFDREGADRLVLLGDLLYHGPRNDLPDEYAPKEVIALLNERKSRLLCVRGNCEAEVDQMVLSFPCMATYNVLYDPDRDRELFLTHGHVYGPGVHNSIDNWPQIPEGSALVYGHTHKRVNMASSTHPGCWVFNPGSVGIPKDGEHSYGVYDSSLDLPFSHHTLL